MTNTTPLSTRIFEKAAARYAAAVLAAAFALLTQWALNPVLGDSLPYITLFPAIAFVAWHCGVVQRKLCSVN